MPIMPEEIATATFGRARQGYHPEEVQAFLREIAADYSAALEKMFLAVDEPKEVDVGQEVNKILRTARDSATALKARSQSEAQAIEKAATEKAQGIEAETSEAEARMLEESSRDARQIKVRADQSAFELRSKTENETSEMVERAEARAGQLFAYNRQLSERLREMEQLVSELRGEIETGDAWSDEAPVEEPTSISGRLEEKRIQPSSDGSNDRVARDPDGELEREGA